MFDISNLESTVIANLSQCSCHKLLPLQQPTRLLVRRIRVVHQTGPLTPVLLGPLATGLNSSMRILRYVRWIVQVDMDDPSDIAADTVTTHLDLMAANKGSNTINKSEIQLPNFTKKKVDDSYCLRFALIYPGGNCASESYFYHTWKNQRDRMKIRKVQKFKKYSDCERFRVALFKPATDGTDTKPIFAHRDNHVIFVADEGRQYRTKTELAKGDPVDELSLAIDGYDQKNYALPHFCNHTKDHRWNGIAVHLVYLFMHAPTSQLRLFTMTDQHENRSKHIAEAIHRVLNDVAKCRPDLRISFIQLDNCTRENKDWFIIAKIELFLHVLFFDVVEVIFLPVGHTHTYIDQVFSTISRRLRTHDATTLSDMHEKLRKC